MIGGIPTNPMESMSWLAAELINLNTNFKVLIFNITNCPNIFESHDGIDESGKGDLFGKYFTHFEYEITTNL